MKRNFLVQYRVTSALDSDQVGSRMVKPNTLFSKSKSYFCTCIASNSFLRTGAWILLIKHHFKRSMDGWKKMCSMRRKLKEESRGANITRVPVAISLLTSLLLAKKGRKDEKTSTNQIAGDTSKRLERWRKSEIQYLQSALSNANHGVQTQTEMCDAKASFKTVVKRVQVL